MVAKNPKPWTKMTTRELAEATKEYDRPFRPPSVPPTKKELAKHREAMRPAPRRRGRPALGVGAQRVLFTIDPVLLEQLDIFARKHGMKRSRMLAASVVEYMHNHADASARSKRNPVSSSYSPAA